MGYDENKVMTSKYLGYEFIGMAVLTIWYLLIQRIYFFYFPISMWAWNHSASHFNIAISFGELMLRSKDLKSFFKGMKPLLAIFLVSFIGGLLGMFIVFLVSSITIDKNLKTIYP